MREPTSKVTKKRDLVFSSITERDVDLLLVEELRCSPKFQNWFLGLLAANKSIPAFGSVADICVQHSVSDSKGSGESDIQLDFTAVRAGRSERWSVFIEDKMAAGFQPGQPQRYLSRAESHKNRLNLDGAVAILVAPEEYLSETPGSEDFNARVSYEQLRSYFDARTTESGEAGTRFAHKAGMLEQAVRRYRRGWTAKEDPVVTRFWADYHRLAAIMAPALQMQRPGKKPASSLWAIFPKALVQKRGLPRCELAHKWSYNKVDLQLAGLAAQYDDLAPVIEPLLDGDMVLRKASKSLAVSIEVPPLDAQQPFASQYEAAAKGLAAALRLQQWYRENSTEMQSRIAAAVGKNL